MDKNRRSFIVGLAQAASLSAVGGTAVAGFVKDNRDKPLALRPPGAIEEKEFLKTCIRCGLCVEACNTRENIPILDGKKAITLQLATPSDDVQMGTPFFVARTNPCYACDDIPCMKACPTGALNEKELTKNKKVSIDNAQIGVAAIDPSSCIAYWGLQCTACYRACPEMDKAITIEWRQNKRTGKHAYRLPIIHEEYCIGCGLCEEACVTEKSAIKIFPREVFLGKAGARYVKGWDKKDQQRVKNASTNTTTETGRSKESAIDNLNQGVSWK